MSKWFDDIAENELPSRATDFAVSFDDAEPPHEIIYEGGEAALERYRQMGAYIHKRLSPSSVFSDEVDTVATSVDSTDMLPSAAGPSRTQTARTSARQLPCKLCYFFCSHNLLTEYTLQILLNPQTPRDTAERAKLSKMAQCLSRLPATSSSMWCPM